MLDRWLALAQDREWLSTIRITPTVLTISRLIPVYEYALMRGANVESCNFLYRPEFMRATVLPRDMREQVASELEDWVRLHDPKSSQIINTRSPDFTAAAAIQDAQSYVNYLQTAPDESHLLPALMAYLKDLDQLRDVCVLDYLPEYENLFRSHGYPT